MCDRSCTMETDEHNDSAPRRSNCCCRSTSERLWRGRLWEAMIGGSSVRVASLGNSAPASPLLSVQGEAEEIWATPAEPLSALGEVWLLLVLLTIVLVGCGSPQEDGGRAGDWFPEGPAFLSKTGSSKAQRLCADGCSERRRV